MSEVAVTTPIRNPAATTTGASVALVLAWVWNDILARKYSWPEMPEAVVVVLSIFVVDIAREWMTRHRETVVTTEPTTANTRPMAPTLSDLGKSTDGKITLSTTDGLGRTQEIES